MASGWGLRGGPGRCHSFYLDFAQCLEGSEDPVSDCLSLREDYFECLHHKKEFARRKAISDRISSHGVPEPEPAASKELAGVAEASKA
mmetsp:Transcript_23814/g.75936  ORF Transcript_23814/g.75936 Transcript_23814/m.75936 type:complete len:88 (-) Transcript_23814:188-451(-)|eukprot:CAMPEP_0202036178 /NCGR_PEP_ID=MMETSP0962-20130828/1387_1 /ASSEMBLY_ACC=CAM_ASM_000488 /TAXON_ID=4773 /ORGANISM="Schizochytrium aggregatum, Strain ATCC28209" /LENGTH=87 /DNA_ID=CAMNT_0048600245 /DNA_START=39 /DNA_END=302 /DNA_ORIENTATION=+